MKLKKGLKFKHIDGKDFVVREVGVNEIVYESKETKRLYTSDRKHFEKYLKRTSKFWNDKTKAYKRKKNEV